MREGSAKREGGREDREFRERSRLRREGRSPNDAGSEVSLLSCSYIRFARLEACMINVDEWNNVRR